VKPVYLLDTNILAEPLRPAPDPVVLAKLKEYGNQLAISSVVWHEMWFGCVRLPKSSRRAAIEKYLWEVIALSMPVIPYDARAAEHHAAERARLTHLGMTPSFVDGQIAAVAYVNELILVTFKLANFQEFQDLKITDWRG